MNQNSKSYMTLFKKSIYFSCLEAKVAFSRTHTVFTYPPAATRTTVSHLSMAQLTAHTQREKHCETFLIISGRKLHTSLGPYIPTNLDSTFQNIRMFGRQVYM